MSWQEDASQMVMGSNPSAGSNVSVKVYLDDYLVNFGFSNVIITSLLPSLLVL